LAGYGFELALWVLGSTFPVFDLAGSGWELAVRAGESAVR
jgi:hypothetical protein